ncbi:MAG TPA: acyl-CoA dehydrogenase family protein [Acidimicrobiales bacterium]|nr:acyl-CoA dehydrogenase family protein [Acidimicrobiales bacterium]
MRRTLYDEAHELFRKTVRTLIEREVAPHFGDWERAGIVDRALYRHAGAAGLLGLTIPEEFGGGGSADFRFEAVIQEEFGASGMLNAGQGILNHNVAVAYLRSVADEQQRARWFPGLASGELLATVAMTEPGTGSDLNAIATRAIRDADTYVLSGAKTFISSAHSSDLVVVACKTGDSGDRGRALSLLVVESGTPGFRRGRNLDKVGQHAADTGELFFDDVAVPAANLLGEENQGFRYLVENLPSERLGIAVVALAHAEAAFGWTLEYCKERHAFGSPIGSFQNSRFALATMRTELDVGSAFVDRQIEALNRGELSAEEAAEAKWWCTDLNRRVLDTCLQLHGGYGYMEEYPIARAWRDGRVMSIYGGTNEIMKELIGRRMLGV